MRDNLERLPQADVHELAYTFTKAGLSVIPGVAELFSLALASPLSKRRERWLNDLADLVCELKKRVEGFKVEDLAENEAFVSATLQATHIALRTHQREKIEALRNALANIALGAAPDEDRQQMFLRFIDEFTASHIRVLSFLQNPMLQLQRSGRTAREFTTPQGALGQMYTNFESERDFYQQMLTDLSAKGLVNVTMLETRMYDVGMVTPTGKAFLHFVESPQGM
jgi:hypothetical protein